MLSSADIIESVSLMTVGIVQFLIVCPLVFLAGFVDAVAGGGGLISLPAYLIAGLPVHFAIATNKMSSAMGTTIATTQYARHGYIPWKQAGFYVVCALVGSGTGAKLALMIDDSTFKVIMLIVLPLTAFYIMKNKTLLQDKEPLSYGKTLVIGMVTALALGIYDGFYGPGTGTFLLIILTSVAHMKLGTANGIAKIINLSTNIAALAVYASNGKVIVPLGLAAGLFSITGSYLGTRFFEKGGAKAVRPVMLAVLGIFFVRVITEIV